MTIEFKQQPLDDMIVVELASEHAAKGAIKLPDWQRYLRGTVIAAGPGAPLYTGGRGPMECKVGDVVTFSPTAGMDTEIGVGNKIRLMRDLDVDTVEEST